MIARLIIAFLIKLLLDLPLMLLGYVIFPLAFWFHDSRYEGGRLVAHFPKWAWLWDNKDHGIDGEGFWAKRTPGWPYWKRCLWWTIIRNPTFNWSKYVLGFKSGGQSRIILGSTFPIGDTKAEGWYYARERWAWEVYYIKAYTLFGVRRCIRFRAGWKLLGKKAGEVAQFCFVPNPLHSYTGK